jgi:hypothetical protein
MTIIPKIMPSFDVKTRPQPKETDAAQHDRLRVGHMTLATDDLTAGFNSQSFCA